ncbi:MAG: TIGR02221 family CRISPR-associated protein [Acidobacteria bacterium]|nr:TIGR02221 family CRISPR-associated protein [Acidobacteriota bacterium]
MTTTLLTFLGRVPKTGNKTENGYRKTCYEFDDGSRTEPVAFFGWPLQKRIAAERLVIMGTAGSMWDHLFERDLVFGQQAEDARIQLMEAVDRKAVTEELLAPLELPLAKQLGCEVRLLLIPYCRNEREQVELLGIMAAHVTGGDTVHIDVSHGFRHLPMIALLAALHLRAARQAAIGGIWYGAFDPDTNEAPVHNLVGLLRIADWIEALHTYDKDGDYGVFSPLLGPAGELLARAAFCERTSNAVKAREALIGWTSRVDHTPADDPAAELFFHELEQRVSWYRQPDRAAWEKELAYRYFEQRDFVRAAIFALEAAISAEIIRHRGDSSDRERREATKVELLNSDREGFGFLSGLRNALAHGVRASDRSVERALGGEATLRDTLEPLLIQCLGPRRMQDT